MRAVSPLLAGIVMMFMVGGGHALPLFTAVVPDLPNTGPGDEGFAVGCNEPCSLDGWAFTDGESTWNFPMGITLEAGQEAWFYADAAKWEPFDMPVPRAIWDGPKLANDGDQVRLVGPDTLVEDAFAWGDETDPDMEGNIRYRSPGLIYRRAVTEHGWTDTNNANDWRTEREYRVGQSVLPAPEPFDVSKLTLYASPDNSFGVLTGLLADAQERAHLHVYEIRSQALADALANSPAASKQVLVTQSPIGLDADDRNDVADALYRIEQAGGTALLAANDRYDYHHLKVLVADDAVAIQSENWVASGVPLDPTWGNRGWGIVVHDEAFADWMDGVLASDRAAWDTIAFELSEFNPEFEPPPRYHARTGNYGPIREPLVLEGTFQVTPMVSPDHTTVAALNAWLGAAETRLWTQQLDLTTGATNDLDWYDDDVLVANLEAAARAGLDVRAQAAQPFAYSDTGNQQSLDWLASSGVQTSMLERNGIATMHNKGIIRDDEVWIGSMNGNHHSRTENREVSVIVSGPGVANYYAELFLADIGEAEEPSFLADSGIPVTPLPILLAGLLLVAAHSWRRP